jgi:hypothetical protein
MVNPLVDDDGLMQAGKLLKLPPNDCPRHHAEFARDPTARHKYINFLAHLNSQFGDLTRIDMTQVSAPVNPINAEVSREILRRRLSQITAAPLKSSSTCLLQAVIALRFSSAKLCL